MFADLRAMDTKQDTFCQSVNNSHVPFLQKDLFCKTSFLQKKTLPTGRVKTESGNLGICKSTERIYRKQ